VDNPAWVYPQPLLDFIAGHYATLQAHQSLATGGTRQQAVAAVLAATQAAEDVIARVRGFYISASDGGERTLELAGVSISTTVSYMQAGPMDAGAGYEVWVVGYDGTNEGSPGNRIAVMG
jgi:DNA-binding transcriptional MocR family regulator